MATANDVLPSAVVEALVTPLSNRIDAAVAKGKFTADKAASMEASLTERVTKFVNANKTMTAPTAVAPTT